MKKYKNGLFRFRKDLRILDNNGLFQAVNLCENILPVFVFDEDLIDKFSFDVRLGFIVDLVKRLKNKLVEKNGNLLILYGQRKQLIVDLLKTYKIEALFLNNSRTIETKNLDLSIKKYCIENKIDFCSYCDNELVDLKLFKPYKVFFHFFKCWLGSSKNLSEYNIEKINLINDLRSDIFDLSEKLSLSKINFKNLNIYNDNLDNYLNNLDFEQININGHIPSFDFTTKLTPYLRFGAISNVQVYNKFIKIGINGEKLLRSFVWRDFFYNLYENFNQINCLEIQNSKRNLNRENNEIYLKSFFDGETGYPIIDAGIIQLKTTGWIHNRIRMILASFFSKQLLIDRRLGEKFFAKYLLDYDQIINSGNWQWTAGVGTDTILFRIYNPILQSQKFDPQCRYILKFLPQLKNQPIKAIHNPLKYKLNYFKPIINHYEIIDKIKKIYLNKN